MKNSKYSETNENILYTEYISESIDNIISYVDYISESNDNNISYTAETSEQKAERIRKERRKKLERIWK